MARLKLLPGMNESESIALFQRMGATAIANQAILKCSVAGFPLTADNVVLFIGDFVDPSRPGCEPLLDMINQAIDEVIDCRALVKPGLRPAAND